MRTFQHKLPFPLPPGPWSDEPTGAEFTHAGLRCLVLRGAPGFAFAGYVRLSAQHPWWGLHPEKLPREAHEAAHGLVDFVGKSGAHDEYLSPRPLDRGWWVGFDCGREQDTSPTAEALADPAFKAAASEFVLAWARRRGLSPKTSVGFHRGGPYRTFDYVTGRVRALAEVAARYTPLLH